MIRFLSVIIHRSVKFALKIHLVSGEKISFEFFLLGTRLTTQLVIKLVSAESCLRH